METKEQAVQVQESDLDKPVVLTADMKVAYDYMKGLSDRHDEIGDRMTDLQAYINWTKIGLDLLRNLDQHNNQELFEDFMVKRRTFAQILDNCGTKLQRAFEGFNKALIQFVSQTAHSEPIRVVTASRGQQDDRAAETQTTHQDGLLEA